MSFRLNWNAIEKDSFAAYTRELLEEALNSGKRPSILSDGIRIVDLNFGTMAPNFQILEIGDLGVDKFRGIFNFKYYGDASITVKTKISASLLKNYNNNIDDEFSFIKPNFIVSDCDFDIPLNLTLSNFKMSSIIIIVFSKSKGLTLVFKNDPLENIDVNSTFDKITPIANFLQKKIESQISDLFKEFLPSLLYKFSLKYTTQSFDQFHRDLLMEEQEEDYNKRKNKVLLKELDPENPFRISPGSLMRSTRLSSMRQTLSLGNGIDKLSCDRFNKNILTKAFLNIIINTSKSYSSLNRIELSDDDFLFGGVHEKLMFGKNFQNRTFLRTASEERPVPKRRTIKMNVKRKPKSKSTSISASEFTPTAMPTTPASVLSSTTAESVNSTASAPVATTDRDRDSVFTDFVDSTDATSTSGISSVSMSKRSSTRGSFNMSRGRHMHSRMPSFSSAGTSRSRRPSSSVTGGSAGDDTYSSMKMTPTASLNSTTMGVGVGAGAGADTSMVTSTNCSSSPSATGTTTSRLSLKSPLLKPSRAKKMALKEFDEEQQEIKRRIAKLDRLVQRKRFGVFYEGKEKERDRERRRDGAFSAPSAPPPYTI